MPREISDSAEELGAIVLAFTSSVRKENILPLFEKYGLDDIQPDQWYPMRDIISLHHELLDVFDKIAWGIEIGKVVTAQSEKIPYEEYVQNLSAVYRSVHRGEDIGNVRGELVEAGHAVITSDTPYPDDLEYGVFYGIAKAMLPPHANVTAYYDEDTVRRDQGGDYTVYHIHWE
jgi:hypothetical protein